MQPVIIFVRQEVYAVLATGIAALVKMLQSDVPGARRAAHLESLTTDGPAPDRQRPPQLEFHGNVRASATGTALSTHSLVS